MRFRKSRKRCCGRLRKRSLAGNKEVTLLCNLIIERPMRASDRRQLSSRMTFFYKFILPAIWISGFLPGTAGFFAGAFRDQNGNPASMDMCWAFLAATVAGAIFLYWTCVRLKVVWL